MPLGCYNIIYSFTSLVGVVLVALTLSWIVKYRGGFGWSPKADLQFNWHPFLMVLGLIFLYSQSILIYRTGRYTITKKIQKYMHGAIHLVAFIVSVVGLQAVFDNHRQTGNINLYSLHSWIGLLTIILFAAQFLGGFVAFLFPGLPGPLRESILPIHVYFGTIAFIMAVITTVAGITEIGIWMSNYKDLPPEAYVLNFMGLFTILYGALTIYLLIQPGFKRIPLPED